MTEIKHQSRTLTDRINVNEPSDVEYWCNRFHCLSDDLFDAVRRVGTSASTVEEFLTSKKMKSYRNLSGDSGIISYEIDDDGILIQFNTGAIYRYTNRSVGEKNIMIMKQLATNGQGLCSFISSNPEVKYGYVSKI